MMLMGLSSDLESISEQAIAESIFNFAANTGVGPAVKIAEVIAGATPTSAIATSTSSS